MIESKDVRTLVDLGFIAVTRGLDKHAIAIFDGVRAVRPDEDAAYIGPALLMIQKGDINGAIKLLRSRPPSDSIRVFLGMALLRHGDITDAIDVLQDLVATAGDPALADLATNLLAATAADGPSLLPR